MGQISETLPTTNKILKILLPTILPIAISALSFLAATTDVTSSGSEVPKATTVKPINRLDKPIIVDKFVALLTTRWLPIITKKIPNKIKVKQTRRECLLSSCSSFFLERK